MRDTFGAYCARRRKTLGLVQKDEADALGYTVQAISRFENGQSQLTLSSLPPLANFLRLSLDDLLNQSETPTPFQKPASFAPEAFAQNLVYFREKKGLSQEEEARALGVKRRTLSNYETGSAIPSLDFVLAFLQLHSLKASALFGPAILSEASPSKKTHSPARGTLLIAGGILLTATSISLATYYGLKGKNRGGDSSFSSLVSSSSAPSTSSSSSPTPSVSSSPVNPYVGNANDYAALTSFSIDINGGTAITLTPKSGYLMTISASQWDDDEDHGLEEWYFLNGNESLQPGDTGSSGFHWQLNVPSDTPDGSVSVIGCRIHSPVDQNHYVESANTVTITISNPLSNYTHQEGVEPLDELTDCVPTLNGQSSFSVKRNRSYLLNLAFAPAGWDRVNFQNYKWSLALRGSSYFSYSQSSEGWPAIGVGDANELDRVDITVTCESLHGTAKSKAFTSVLTIYGSAN